jgi:protein subunit release factor B
VLDAYPGHLNNCAVRITHVPSGICVASEDLPTSARHMPLAKLRESGHAVTCGDSWQSPWQSMQADRVESSGVSRRENQRDLR